MLLQLKMVFPLQAVAATKRTGKLDPIHRYGMQHETQKALEISLDP